MDVLGDNVFIGKNITNATTNAIKAFHYLVFGNDHSRRNRRELREFKGFEFTEDSEEYKNKLDYINQEMNEGDLVLVCDILNLTYQGSKIEAAEMICRHLIDFDLLTQNAAVEEDEDESDEEENGSVDGRSSASETSVRHREPSPRPRFHLSLKDMEDSIRPFTGEHDFTLVQWIDEIENNCKLMKWTPLETFILGKKLLRGLAKTFIRSEPGIREWAQLKRALAKEFPQKLNSAKVHEKLSKRKMKKEESVHEYFLIMKEIANRGTVENEALIQYVIDGIQDDPQNKSVLFGVTKISAFKEKLRIYEDIRKKSKQQPSDNYKFKSREGFKKKEDKTEST